MSDTVSFTESLFNPAPAADPAPSAPAAAPASEAPFAPPASTSPAAAAPAPEQQPFAPASAPATPAQPETPQAPAAPGAEPSLPAQPPAPVVPPEFTRAHEFWTKVEPLAAPLGGVDMIPNAVQWTSMLFGLGERPVDQTTGQPMAPEVHFLNTLQQADPGIYSAFASELIDRHKAAILNTYRNEILQQLNIPAEKLEAVQSYLKYGDQSVDSEAEREFIQGLAEPSLIEFYRKQPASYRAHLVNSMPVDLAKEALADKKYIKDSQAQSEQTKQAEQQRQVEQQEYEVATLRESHIQKSELAFVSAKAKELNVPEQQVGDWLQLVGLEMDREVSKVQAELKQMYRSATPEQLASATQQKSEVARTWNQLTEACKSRNELRINAAMNQFRLLVETRFHHFLAGRKTSAPAPAAPPAEHGAPRVPEFPPTPLPTTAGGGNSFVKSLFGEGDPQASWQ